MVFDETGATVGLEIGSDIQLRYETYPEALAGHEVVCRLALPHLPSGPEQIRGE